MSSLSTTVVLRHRNLDGLQQRHAPCLPAGVLRGGSRTHVNPRRTSRLTPCPRKPSLVVRSQAKGFGKTKNKKKSEESLAGSGKDSESSSTESPGDEADLGSSKYRVPCATREQVFQACFATCAVVGLAGEAMRAGSSYANLSFIPNLAELLPLLPPEGGDATLQAFGYAGGAVILVSAARSSVLRLWPAYRAAWRFSNTQALTELDGFDLVWVSALPGISEELLFRGALMPLVGMNIYGALASAAVFGLLHQGNGRTISFQLFAGLAGLVYGGLALYTQSLAAPMLAHTLSNLASALRFKQQQQLMLDELTSDTE
mmetsp:Transcript_188/g.617  ORF Transcript_188/g.617 Transcript_188/m.617 type:complete len:316 (+) Transcript_188:62-1009(+)